MSLCTDMFKNCPGRVHNFPMKTDLSALTVSIHLSSWLLGNHQICLDSVRQCPPHLPLGLWAHTEICFPEPGSNHSTHTSGKTSPLMMQWYCFDLQVYENHQALFFTDNITCICTDCGVSFSKWTFISWRFVFLVWPHYLTSCWPVKLPRTCFIPLIICLYFYTNLLRDAEINLYSNPFLDIFLHRPSSTGAPWGKSLIRQFKAVKI